MDHTISFAWLNFWFFFFTSSQLFSNDVFFFIHSTPTTKNKSLRKNNHTQTHTFTTLMLLFWALNVGINFRIQPKIYFEKWGSSNGKKGGSPPPSFWFYPPRAVLPRQTFLTHCVLHCAVTDSLARGCSWNHGRNTAKCSVVCVYSTRARRAFSCRPGRSVYTIVLVVPWCCSGWHYIVIV